MINKFSDNVESSPELINIYQDETFYAWCESRLWREEVANRRMYRLNSIHSVQEERLRVMKVRQSADRRVRIRQVTHRAGVHEKSSVPAQLLH